MKKNYSIFYLPIVVSVIFLNIARRPSIRRLFIVTITYDTPTEKITRALEILREILAIPEGPEGPDPGTTEGVEEVATERQPHPNEAINQPDFEPRVYFNEMNAVFKKQSLIGP